MTESKYISTKLRDLVAKRANYTCEYCRSQADFSADSFSVEHILPRILDGKTIAKNLALSCQGCNSHKAIKTAAIDPISETLVALFNPRIQNWDEHFAWDKNFTELIRLDTNRQSDHRGFETQSKRRKKFALGFVYGRQTSAERRLIFILFLFLERLFQSVFHILPDNF